MDKQYVHLGYKQELYQINVSQQAIFEKLSKNLCGSLNFKAFGYLIRFRPSP